MHDARDAEDIQLLEANRHAELLAVYWPVVVDRLRLRLPDREANEVASDVADRLLTELRRGRTYSVPFRVVVHKVIEWKLKEHFTRGSVAHLPEEWDAEAPDAFGEWEAEYDFTAWIAPLTPARGGWWHAVPRGGDTAYCTLDTAEWQGQRQRDDTHEVTCPWCRLRLIALEIVAPPGPRRLEAWHELCIYTMRHSDELAQWESVGRGEAREQKAWRQGTGILEDARSQGTIVAVIFSAAESSDGLIYYARLDDVNVGGDGTSYFVSRVFALPERYALSSLVLESTGEPLSDSYIRPYAICRTPAFLPAPTEQPPPLAAEGLVSTRTVAERGIQLVVEEVHRRGGTAVHAPVPKSRNNVRVVAPNGRELSVYVKTRRDGDWQTDIRKGEKREPDGDETTFWVLVDLSVDPIDFYVAPEWWIQNNIYDTHAAYLARHGGQRAKSPASTHHGISTDRVAEWRGRWDLLGVASGSADQPTLHEEIARILSAHGGGWMTVQGIADEVNAAGRYRKKDGSDVRGLQIHGRTRNYPHLFERDGSRMRLRPE